MKKKIFIHLGYPKTGTTWLQEVFFTKIDKINLIFDKKHFSIIKSIKDTKKFYDLDRAISKNFQISKTNIISDEDFLHALFKDRLQILINLKKFLDLYDYDYEVFFFHRKQEEIIPSYISQNFRYLIDQKINTKNLLSFFDKNQKKKECCNLKYVYEFFKYSEVFSLLKNIFSEEKVHSFDYQLFKFKDSNFYKSFSDFLKINVKDAIQLSNNMPINVSKHDKNTYLIKFKSGKLGYFKLLFNQIFRFSFYKNFYKKLSTLFFYLKRDIYEFFISFKKENSRFQINDNDIINIQKYYLEDNKKFYKLK